MKVAILGHTGMLGGMLKRYLEEKYLGNSNIEVICLPSTFRVSNDGAARSDLHYYLGDRGIDYVVNCIGAIKPRFNSESSNIDEIYTNAIFPRELANWCLQETAMTGNLCRLIHVTTDCVFNGDNGPYDELDEHSASDEYGKSKSLGEPKNSIVIRTSIIGPEWNGNARSLISWFLKQDKANGYTNHLWNGLTTLELSKCIDKIMFGRYLKDDIYHLFSTDVTKYELLVKMGKAFGKSSMEITKVEVPEDCDRLLRTVKNLNIDMKIAGIDTMLSELARWID